jgi:hypothetical protein
MKDNNYQLLIEKLDQFIRKYYVNQLIRGGLYATGLILALFLGLNFAENFAYFPPSVKTPLVWGFVGISAIALWVWVLMPAMHYFHLGKIISHEQAAMIIGDHFANVKDKLLNILQLRKQADGQENRDLILASINQKSEEIKPVPFKAAIDLTKNRKNLRYALPPLLLLLFVLFAAPSLIRNASTRLFNYNKEFEREAPFKFFVDKEKLKVVQFQDYDLTVKVDGAILPNDVFIEVNGYEYRLQKSETDPTVFSYKFSGVQKDVPFKLFSGAVASPQYSLEVLKKPNMAGFDVKLDYPEYIGRADEMLANQGDLIVPAGTNIAWLINAENTDDIKVSFNGGNPLSIIRQGDTRFTFSKKVSNDEPYKLLISNAYLPKADSVTYTISVVPDLYPTIAVEKFEDSLNRKRLFFVGEAGDDYGLRGLTFNYQVKRNSGQQEQQQRVPLPNPTNKAVSYQYTFNIADLDLRPGDEVSYFFEVFDNDGVNGSKSTKTNLMVYSQPSVQQIEKQMAKNNEEIKDDLKKAMQETKKIQQDLQKLREKMLQQKEVDWQMKKEAEKLQQRQQELEKQIDEAKKNFEENLKQEQELNKQDEEIMKKQEQIQQMFEDLKNPEMKELLRQIEELLQKMDKDEALEKMEDMKFSNEEMQKELERMEELFKQLEVESMMQEQIEKLEELAQKQEKLSEDTEGSKKDQETLKKEQEQLNKAFEELEKKQDDMEKKNDALKRKEEMPDTKEEDKEIKEDQKESQENIEQKQNSKASKKQKSAANKMKNKANKMKQAQQQGEMEQMEEDMRAIRQLLENLVSLSFDQEQVMKDFGPTAENTPRYVKLTQQQKKLQGDFALIEDSLQALATRQAAIQTFVIEKVTDIKQGFSNALEKLEDRKKYEGQEAQQRTMKNVNDLALMLSEAMQNMQNQMSSMPGNGSCKKPGGNGQSKGKSKGEPKDKMSEGQKSINEDLKKQLERLKKGGGGKGGAGMSKEFAQMAARQAAMREALKKKQKELQERGKGDKGLQDIIDEMEKTETELVNKTLTNQSIKRQDEILTRLLESEKAERERKEDEERKANTAREQQNEMPAALKEYIKKREAEIEQYQKVSPSLKPYYKTLVEEYFKTLKGGR